MSVVLFAAVLALGAPLASTEATIQLYLTAEPAAATEIQPRQTRDLDEAPLPAPGASLTPEPGRAIGLPPASGLVPAAVEAQ